MDNCYSVDHIAEDLIRTNIICHIEESQQKYRIGTVSKRLLNPPHLVITCTHNLLEDLQTFQRICCISFCLSKYEQKDQTINCSFLIIIIIKQRNNNKNNKNNNDTIENQVNTRIHQHNLYTCTRYYNNRNLYL